MKIKKICKQCGKKFEVFLSSTNADKFCSKKCYLKSIKIPENNPRWKMGKITKFWLYQKYWIKELSLSQIAKLCDVSIATIRNWMVRFDINRRTISEAENIKYKPFKQKSWSYQKEIVLKRIDQFINC